MIDVLFSISYLALWIMTIALSVAVFVLYRHLGMQLLNTRERRMQQGPEVSSRLAIPRLTDIDGRALELSQPTGPVLLFIASTACAPCADARSTLATFAVANAGIRTVLVCRGTTKEEVRRFTTELPPAVRVVPDLRWELGSRLGISGTPLALITDASLVVRGKGAPTSSEAFDWFRQQLLDESLGTEPRLPVAAPAPNAAGK